MTFFKLCSAYLTLDEDKYLELNVISDNGIEVTPYQTVKVTDLNRDASNLKYRNFLNVGDAGITFKIKVIIHRDEIWNTGTEEYLVTDVLKDWISNSLEVNVVTEAIDIEDGTYVITKNSSRQQNYTEYTIWTLEFTTFNPYTIYEYTNDTSQIKKALQKAKKDKETQAKQNKTSKTASSKNSKLAKCKLKDLTYSKKKKYVKRVEYMQKPLKKKGYYTGVVDGWFGSLTTKAVQKYQKKYKKKDKLKTNGKVDKATLQSMVKRL